MAKNKKISKSKQKEYPYYPSMFKNRNIRTSGFGRVVTTDTENIGLLPDLRELDSQSGHVIVVKDRETGETFVFFDPYEKRDPKERVWLNEWEGEQDGFLMDGIKFLNETDVIVCQNWLGYDHHAMRKIHGDALKVNWKAKPRNNGGKRTKKYPFRVMDTLLMSQLLNPERRLPREAYALQTAGKLTNIAKIGPHSIEAHGIRMGRFKPENNDWTKLTDYMIHRCWEDVAIGDDFFDFLMREWYEQSAPNPVTGLTIADAYRMEAVMYYEMAAQEQRGFRLDMNFAWKLVKRLDKHKARILKNAMPHIPLRLVKKKLDHTAMRNAARRTGADYHMDKKVSHERLVALTTKESDKLNKKLLKSWLKAGGKARTFIPRRFKVVKKKDYVTHGSSRATNWGFVTKARNYSSNTTKDFPNAVGSIDDYKRNLRIVVGPYTPVSFEQVSLGNRDIVRQALYLEGWRGVNLTDGEKDYVEDKGEVPYYWVGKLDDDSIKAWKERAAIEPPKWATDILEYYIVTHRRSQILNEKDMAYYAEHGEWAKQINGKRECRGLVPRSRCKANDKSFQELMEQYGLDFWYKKQFDKDGEYRVPSSAFAIGTNTFRMRHKYVVNIPSRGLYGKEMRQLFIAAKGWMILGCDGAGLELRMLSHFMNDKEYEAILLNGDIHLHNQELAGLPIRDMAKTFIYAFLYGSGILGLALGCGVSEAKMRKVVGKFLEELPLLDDLIKGVQEAAQKKGYLKAVDGRLGRVRKSGGELKIHTALNVLLQMTGSLCMKWGLYFALELFEKFDIPARLVCNMHDEVQMEVREEEVESFEYKIDKADWKVEEKKVMHHENGDYYSAPSIIRETKKGKLILCRTYHKAGHLLCKAFEEAGKYLKIRTPLAGEYKVGDSWAKTH